jgi:hypothetical protein
MCKLPLAVITTLLCSVGQAVIAQDSPPNILVIWGDDIGWSNVSA